MAKIKCKNCGKEINNDSLVCINCGAKVEEQLHICEDCGKKFDIDLDACPNCGCPYQKVKDNALNDNKDKCCPDCGHVLALDDKVCPECGCPLEESTQVLPKKKNTKKKLIISISSIFVLLVVIIVTFVGINKHISKQKDDKYNEAISYFEEGNYDAAYKSFSELGYHELSHQYVVAIEMIRYIDKEEYERALKISYELDDDVDIFSTLKKYAQYGVYYKEKNYKAIYEDTKYLIKFYDDKEKEIVYDSHYNYAKSLYNEGYYSSTKDMFERIKDYKDVSNILKDKYFNLVGNNYNYSVQSGYNWGYMSILFYSSSDRVNYTVFTQSLFNTNIPSGYEYSYRIKNNKLIMGNNDIVYDIVSFNGNTLVIKQGQSKFTLKKA